MARLGRRACACVIASLLLVGCGGGGGGTGGNNGGGGGGTTQPQPQSIAFAEAGPVNALLSSTTTNLASGGAGTGAITYSSNNPSVAIVDANSGAVTAVGVGSTVITATKAASASHSEAQATYTLRVQTADTISAWIGAASTDVALPLNASGRTLGRARVSDCTVTDTVATCAGAETSSGTSVTDTRATLTTPAYYALVNGATVGTPVTVTASRFSGRYGHGVVYFKDRYWVIGGGSRETDGNALWPSAEVWSSADGTTWKLETAQAEFGPRWFHQAFVYGNEIFVVSGSGGTGITPVNDVWSSVDGVTWRMRVSSAHLGLPWASTYLNVVPFRGSLWAVSGGTAYSSPTALFQQRSAAGALGQERAFASLTVFNNRLWYIGGSPGYRQPDGGVPPAGDGANDVWSSEDGITWTQVTANAPFAPRFQHTAFVRNGRLWVFGGRRVRGGFIEEPAPNDAWSTLDGVNWTKEPTSYLARSFLSKSVESTAVPTTLIGGVQRGFSNQFVQALDASDWTLRSSNAQFSPRHADLIEFNGSLWFIGGASIDSRDSPSGTTNEIWRSGDGINWLPVPASGSRFAPRTGHRMAVFNNRLWLIGGWDDYATNGGSESRFNDVWSSADGVSWSRHADAGFVPRAGHALFVFNNKLWVIGGSVGTNQVANDIWSSANGENWTREVSSAAFSPRVSHRVAVLNNTLFLTAGNETSSGKSDVWKSSDGVNWTLATEFAFPARTRHALAVLNNKLYVIGGASDDTFDVARRFNDVWSSSDGVAWAQVTSSAAFEPRSLHGVVTRNNELWLVGGLGYQLLNDVWRSSDGAQWRLGFSHTIAAP